MISLEQALKIVGECAAQNELGQETIPVSKALGRRVAAAAISRMDLPPFDRSAVDGYAVLKSDERKEYRILGQTAAGEAAAALEPGLAVRVMTGAPVPPGTGRVVMLEHAEEVDGQVRFPAANGRSNVCRRAEDVSNGDVVLASGSCVRPAEMALLTACNVPTVSVASQPRLTVISTGNEICQASDGVCAGKIIDSNGPMLSSLARMHGFGPVRRRWVRDNPAAICSRIAQAAQTSDIIILSGGISAGDFDFVAEAMRQAGASIHFSRVRIRPGRPTTFGSIGKALVFALPGNPVAVWVTFHLFVVYAVAMMMRTDGSGRTVRLPLGEDFKRRVTDRTDFVLARLQPDGSLAQVAYHGSAHIAAVVAADGWFAVDEGPARLSRGELVDFHFVPQVLQ